MDVTVELFTALCCAALLVAFTRLVKAVGRRSGEPPTHWCPLCNVPLYRQFQVVRHEALEHDTQLVCLEWLEPGRGAGGAA